MAPENIHMVLVDGLSQEEAAPFYKIAVRRMFDTGAAIIQEGEPGETLYVVVSGIVQVEKAMLDQQQEVLTTLGPGECFGELALIDRKPRSATVRASCQTEVLEWSRSDLDALFESAPLLHRRVLENLAKIAAQRIRRLDETLVHSVYDSIIWLDKSGRIRGWKRLTDRRTLFDEQTEDVVLGQDLFVQAAQLGEGLRQKLMQIMARGEMTVLPLDFEEAGGEMAYFEMTVASREDGAVLGVRDVTESKALELRLIQAQKLAMAGQMSAEIGHELKNYVTVIIGHVELLLVDPEFANNARISRSLQAISNQVDRMEQFASGLMDLGMLRSQMEPSDLNLLVEKLVSFIQGQRRFRRVEFVLHLDGNLPLVPIDPGQIQQVLINLYANAADAMGKGQIDTATKFDPASGQVAVTVTDQGPGMSEAVLARIFESGFTTKKTGHGFGLAICKRIVENHKGQIAMTSEVGKSTTCTLTFPVE